MVVLDTPICRAKSEQETPRLDSRIKRLLFSRSTRIAGQVPFLRPNLTPSCFRLANASLVRMEIKLRSISAINPNANPNTLLLMSF